MFHIILGSLLGYIAGVFTPGIARKIKSEFSAEGKKAVSLVDGEVKAAELDAKNELKKL